MVYAKKKISPYWYLLILANLLPAILIFADIWTVKHAIYFYWGECVLVAIFAMAMYAKYLIVFFLLTGSIGGIVYLANPYLLENMQGILVFWSLYSICWIAYVEIGRSNYGQLIRRLTPGEQLGIYIFSLGVSNLFCFMLTGVIAGDWIPGEGSMTFYKTFGAVAVLVPSISTGILKVIDMIGEKHFVDFLLGTYYQPVERDRVVLFLDMVGSSSMAERLEPRTSMKMIAQFIYDCGFIFRIHGGDILNYTGDGLVVLWPIKQANSALAAAYKLRMHFMQKEVRSRFWKRFGVVPEFRIGIHAGHVVLSQIGEEKLFIGLYGDVVNTAARLEQMNKELDTNILVSAEVVRNLNQSWRAMLKPLGEQSVRGRDEKIQVYAIYKDI